MLRTSPGVSAAGEACGVFGFDLVVAKAPAPYVGEPGEQVPVRVTGAIHLFDPAGPRLATSMR